MIEGIAGMVLVVMAWLLETVDAARRHRNLLDMKFAALYLPGTFLVLLYAVRINNMLFAALEGIIISLVMVEIAYTTIRICACRAGRHILCGCAKHGSGMGRGKHRRGISSR